MPMGDSGINKIEELLLEVSAQEILKKKKESSNLIQLLSLLAKLNSDEEEKNLVEAQRKDEKKRLTLLADDEDLRRTIEEIQKFKKLASKKSKRGLKQTPNESNVPIQTPADFANSMDSTVTTPVDDGLVEMVVESPQTGVIPSSEVAPPFQTEVPTGRGVASPDDDSEDDTEVDGDEDEADTSVPEAAGEPPLTKEEIKQSLYEKVMATVPEGRIHQRVLDRLIGQWLDMTQIPLDQLTFFVRGSHRKIHGAGKGVTVVTRHGRSDRTYAPGEARRLAKEVVGLAANN